MADVLVIYLGDLLVLHQVAVVLLITRLCQNQ